MKQTWRWFGPKDLVSIDDVVQAGAEGIVSALHHLPTGSIWTTSEIAKRQAEIGHFKDGSKSGLKWDVVESLPVSEDIKKQNGDWRTHIQNYKASLKNLADSGLEVICYNFMPVLDWTRTDLAWKVKHGGTCMRFDLVDFAAFDLFILKRPDAPNDFDAELKEAAEKRFAEISDARKEQLASNIVCGLPGAAEHFSLEDVRTHIAEYADISEATLQAHLIDFLTEVAPVAQKLGLRLCCHPDDPPVPLLGLPRVMSTEAHYTKVMKAVDVMANGITLCSGSLGARPDNDLPGMMSRLGDRVHFLHLRNVLRETDGIRCSFHEAEHLGGNTDMVALIHAIVHEEARRKAEGRSDYSLPIRPDHGQNILDDLTRNTQPGYPAIGRMKGLAELRGIFQTLQHPVIVAKRVEGLD